MIPYWKRDYLDRSLPLDPLPNEPPPKWRVGVLICIILGLINVWATLTFSAVSCMEKIR